MPELRHFRDGDPFITRWHDRIWLPQLCSLIFFLCFGAPMWGVAAHCYAEALNSNVPYSVAQQRGYAVSAVVLLLASVPVGALGGALGAFFVHRDALGRLRSELRRRGIPICIACGYEGGTIDIPRCPECGVVHTPVA